VNGIQQIKDMK